MPGGPAYSSSRVSHEIMRRRHGPQCFYAKLSGPNFLYMTGVAQRPNEHVERGLFPSEGKLRGVPLQICAEELSNRFKVSSKRQETILSMHKIT